MELGNEAKNTKQNCRENLDLILKFNDTKAEYSRESTIHKLIEDQVKRAPNQIALVFEDTQLTYNELNERANQFANVLRKKSIKPNDLVAIIVRRSPEMIIAIIGVLKAGGAYLPIDPNYPPERIEYMLKDSGASFLLSQLDMGICIEFEGESINIDDKSIANESRSDIADVNNSSDLAYVMYTSGSTGEPKGVMIEHKGVVNFFKGVTDKIDFSPEKSILALSTMSFDIFVLETLLPLSRGLKIILADENERNNPKLLNELFVKQKIDMFQVTPSRIQQLINFDSSLSILKEVKEIMIGGEPFPQKLLKKLKLFKNLKIYNMYGPTETTVWSAVACLTDKEEIDIGQPIANMQMYIVDNNNNLLPVSSKGEICIAGDGLGRGYLNRPELNREKFISNPVISGSKMYKSGDVGRWLPDGRLEYFGRVDNQVKIKGHRIELEEIEAQLVRHKYIREAAVSGKDGKDGVKYLCAYVVRDEEVSAFELKDHLSKILPDFMIPASFIFLDKLPLTPNGKIDRKLLINYDETSTTQPEETQVTDDESVRSRLIKIMRESIEGIPLPNIIDDSMSLFDIGFDSISYVWLIAVLEEEFGFQIKDEFLDYNSFPKFKDLVAYVESEVNFL